MAAWMESWELQAQVRGKGKHLELLEREREEGSAWRDREKGETSAERRKREAPGNRGNKEFKSHLGSALFPNTPDVNSEQRKRPRVAPGEV